MGNVKKDKKREKKHKNILELSEEVVYKSVRMVSLDDNKILIENHSGIKEYTEKSIRIDSKNISILISGEKLTLENLQRDDIAINGEIKSIVFDKKVGV
ncbi:MAG: YabP/YqfC family sporulation protein [Eubacteriales bacterium]